MVKIEETIVQTGEDYNAVPRIEVQDAFIKEIEIEKQLIARGDLKHPKPIYKIRIRILDDIGGRHEVTSVKGFCKGDLVVRV